MPGNILPEATATVRHTDRRNPPLLEPVGHPGRCEIDRSVSADLTELRERAGADPNAR
jgi:hypothetical protein